MQSSYEFIAINFSTIYSFCKSLLMEECEKEMGGVEKKGEGTYWIQYDMNTHSDSF